MKFLITRNKTAFRRRIIPWIDLLLMAFLCLSASEAASSPQTGMVLRVRLSDGSIERIQVQPGADPSLQDVLAPIFAKSDSSSITNDDNNNRSMMIQIGSKNIEDDSQTISELGLKPGSLITLVPKKKKSDKSKQHHKPSFSTSEKKASDRWDPFPEIAKDHESAVRKTKTRRSTQSGMSFGDLADLQSSLHIVDPQPEGPLKRVYMCSKSAERFKTNCYKKSKNEFENRVGLLLGTVQRERVDLKPKARTSLSSQTESEQYCNVAKVHALWEPLTQQQQQSNAKLYDAKPIQDFQNDPEIQRVFRLAELLGLRPVGWIFTYNDDRHKEEGSLSVHGPDAKRCSLLQIANMKRMGRIDGSQFATLSMDVTSGVTEAFHLSDVCVQMVAEGLWDEQPKKGATRFVHTKHAVIVDGKETKELDSVLCLVNIAMMSHEGSFAGTTTNSVKKNGTFTNKVKKAVLSAIDANDDGKLLDLLTDFNLLLALDRVFAKEDMENICEKVRKYARGQKRGTELDDKLKLLLRSVLDH